MHEKHNVEQSNGNFMSDSAAAYDKQSMMNLIQ